MHACTPSLQSYLTPFYPMDCSLWGSSVHGSLQARVLEWVAMPSSRRSSQPRDQACISCFARWTLYPLSHLGSRWYCIVGFFLFFFFSFVNIFLGYPIFCNPNDLFAKKTLENTNDSTNLMTYHIPGPYNYKYKNKSGSTESLPA